MIDPGAARAGAAALPHGLDLGAAEHFELNATVLEGGDGIDIGHGAADRGGGRDVPHVRVQPKLIVKLVSLVDAVRAQAQDLAGSTRQVDHAAIADDELAGLSVRQQVAVTKSGAGFEAQRGALENCAEKALSVASQQGRGLPELGQDNAGEAVSRERLRQGERHLLLEAVAYEHVDDRVLAGDAGGGLDGGRGLPEGGCEFVRCVHVLLLDSLRLFVHAARRRTRVFFSAR